jgi:hypothetical protein
MARSEAESELVARLVELRWTIRGDLIVVPEGPEGWCSCSDVPHVQVSFTEGAAALVGVTVINYAIYPSGTRSMNVVAPELVELRDDLLRLRNEFRAMDMLAMLG